MTVLNLRQKVKMRDIFKRRIHNDTFTVKLFIDETVVQKNPQIGGVKKPRYAEFTDFKGSIYDALSGVVSRIAQRHVEFSVMPAGIMDNTFFALQYVPDEYNLLATAGQATNAGGGEVADQLIDETKDFKILPVRVGAKVLNLTDGSSALVTAINSDATKLDTEELSGGDLNIYSEDDEYEIYNSNNLRPHDSVRHLDKWREVLYVVRDSEGVQTTVFLAE